MVNNNDITNTKENSLIDDTSLHSGLWQLVMVTVAATFTTLNDNSLVLGSYSGKTYAVGTQLVGKFTDIQLSSGEVIAYA
jgi:hypothetical protein